MSCVKTPDARPYSVALALFRTASTSLRKYRREEHSEKTRPIKEENDLLACVMCSSYLPLNLEMIMMGPNDSSLARCMWSCTSANTVGSKKNPGRRHTRQDVCGIRQTASSIRTELEPHVCQYLDAGLVCHHRPGWLPPWHQSDNTPPVCPSELCGSEGRGLWNGPVDHRSLSFWPPQPERKTNRRNNLNRWHRFTRTGLRSWTECVML